MNPTYPTLVNVDFYIVAYNSLNFDVFEIADDEEDDDMTLKVNEIEISLIKFVVR